MRDADPVWSRWEDVDRVFGAVLDVPEAERTPTLERLCGDDSQLLYAVTDLLGLSRTDDPRSRGPGPDLLRAACGGPARGGKAIGPGDRLGRYRIVGTLGHGGMATVYEAERSDGTYRQAVALKVLRRGLDTDRIVARFLAERQILSDFAHPNIARLLDGGATEDGRPYLVMEKVNGQPLPRWADRGHLNTDERLRLFLQVTEAVHEAHRRLVVHRDIKPSNVLVNAEGTVKLLDFGIAKLLDADSDGTDLTGLGPYPLTRRYASPEQMRGEAVTASSDVYQLGLVLHELLTGLRPFEDEPVSSGTAAVRGEPRRPSQVLERLEEDRALELAHHRATTPRALGRRLRGDLDTIVCKALQPEAPDRYRSADEMGQDIRLHLEGRPIRARPASRWLRIRKWVRRNRWAPPAAAVLALATATYVGTLAVTARQLEVERDEARAQAERAERVTAFLTSVFEVTNPNETGGMDLTVLELLDASVARAATELEGQPATEARVLSTIGAMYRARGRYERAESVLERAVDLGRVAGADPADVVRDRRRLAAAVRNHSRAASILEEAVTVAEREIGPDHPLLAATLTDLATHLSRLPGAQARERAGATLERALVILRAQTGDVRAQLAAALDLSAQGGDLSDLPKFEEALELRRSLHGEDHTVVAGTLNNMALLLEPYDPEATDTLLARAAEINARIHGPDHSRTLAILNNRAGGLRDRGKYAEAEPLYREILKRRRAAYPADSIAHAYIMHGLGWSLTELGRPEEAEPMLREVVRRTDPGPERTATVHQMARSTLGRSLAAQGRYAEAEATLRDSYERTAAHAPDSQFIPTMLERLIDLYDAWGRTELADRYRALHPRS